MGFGSLPDGLLYLHGVNEEIEFSREHYENRWRRSRTTEVCVSGIRHLVHNPRTALSQELLRGKMCWSLRRHILRHFRFTKQVGNSSKLNREEESLHTDFFPKPLSNECCAALPSREKCLDRPPPRSDQQQKSTGHHLSVLRAYLMQYGPQTNLWWHWR